MAMIRCVSSIFLLSAFLCASADASDCSSEIYRRYNPDKCSVQNSENKFSFATTATITGGTIAAIGGAIALFGTSGNGGGDNSNNTAHPTLPTYNMVGGDVDFAKLSAATSTKTYTQNQQQYDEIRVAYSLARGYTGANSKIAVFDSSATTWHGRNVAYLASGEIAPNATVQTYTIADKNGTFVPFKEIGEIISTASDAHIYNFSWSANNAYATQINSRHQLEQITDKNFIDALSNAANNNDAIFVWAAGNDYNTQSSALSAIPLHVPETNGHFVNVVAWDTSTNQLADFSNACGITKDYCITAPGTDIKNETGSSHLNGTSFAAPIVSAAIAVIREAFPYMKAGEITNLLFTTARDIGDVGIDAIYGHGMLDLERATRPVGAQLVPLSETTSVPLNTARVSGAIAHNIKSQNIKFAFIDDFGRAFDTSLNENISIKNRSIGFERLRENSERQMQVGKISLGFKSTELLQSDGILQTDSQNLISFIGINETKSIGKINLTAKATFGTMNPIPSAQSMISSFSNIYTASVSFAAKYNKFGIFIGTPDTIIRGNMHLNTPTGRMNNGDYIFNKHKIALNSRPSIEYGFSYKFMTAAFVDNPYGKDEFYILAKTKISF